MDLTTNYLGLHLPHPVMPGASPLADSLDTVELVMALEDEFGLDIPDEEAEKLTTVGKAMEYILGHAK